MAHYHIRYVRKDKDGDITNVKTIHHQFTLNQVIQKIEVLKDYFWVRDKDKDIPVKVINRQGRKYIRTLKDNRETNNLDSLPEF